MQPFSFPSVWDDDDAMFDLMQPIRRPKHVDPDTYNHKVAFWASLISEFCRTQRVLIVSIRALSSFFSRYFTEEQIFMSPACLSEVIRVLQVSGAIKAYSDLGVVSMLRNGFHYILRLPFYLFSDDSTGQQASSRDYDSLFIVQEFVEVFLDEFFTHFNSTKIRKRITPNLPAYELNEFESCLAEFFPHELTRTYIRKLCVQHYRCVEIVRVDNLGLPDASDLVWVSEQPKVPVSVFSKSDNSKTNLSILTGLVRLRVAINRQEQEEKRLTAKIEERRNEIRTLMTTNKIQEAKALLKRTKLLEETLERRQLQLQNLEAMQLQISSSSDNQLVLRTLAESGRALKQIVGSPPGIDLVGDTMSDLVDGFKQADDVSDLICSLGRTVLSDPDEDELESELRILLRPSHPESPASAALSTHPDKLDAHPIPLRPNDLLLPEITQVRDLSSGRKSRSLENPLTT